MRSLRKGKVFRGEFWCGRCRGGGRSRSFSGEEGGVEGEEGGAGGKKLVIWG